MYNLQMSDKSICRLCMDTTKFTHNFNKTDGAKIIKKIKFCIDVEISREDGMPALICKPCIKEIKRFYNFKRKCLKTDQELRNMMNHATVVNDLNKPTTATDITPNPYFTEGNVDDCKDVFDLYTTSNINEENKNNKIYTEEIKINPEKPYYSDELVINIENPVELSNELQPYKVQCEVCGCIFETKAAFRKHLSSHSGIIKSFLCDFCPKTFTRAENSIIHMRSHMGIKPFICEICGQSSTKRQDLIRHMKIHSDERSHACQNCGRCFKRSFDLYRHMHTHTGVRPYKCRLCEKDYTSHSGLRKHYKTHGKLELR